MMEQELNTSVLALWSGISTPARAPSSRRRRRQALLQKKEVMHVIKLELDGGW
jgi:hypothetical protein